MERFAYSDTLAITFTNPVFNHRFCLRCIPNTDSRQHILSAICSIAPHGKFWVGKDSFGASDQMGLIRQPHNAFFAESYGVAEIADTPWTQGTAHPMYGFPSAMTQPQGELADFAEGLSLNGTPMEQIAEISAALRKVMVYTSGATDISDTASAAFAEGKGVCQDYVHICLTVLRKRKIKARYVAGLMPGEGQSHAWLEVWQGNAWYGFDPTNHCEITAGYLKLTHGRDSRDCFLNRGIFQGGQVASQQVLALVTKE